VKSVSYWSGLKAVLWTEFVHSRARVDRQTFPRLAAVSDTAWTAKGGRDYQDFFGRLGVFEQRLEALGVQSASPECYRKYQHGPLIPAWLQMVFSKDHPALAGYRRYRA
jgi:N-acetyl-beta-hexosaminidase